MTTRDIVTIAILSSLGGALSTFVGYLGNMVNLALGVPFGAGQFMAGLHVFWLVLIRILVPRSGTGTIAGLLKGMVEMFTGSTHGVVVVLVSLAQGLVIDLGVRIAGNGRNPGSRLIWWITAGLSSAVNVVVFQILYFTGAPIWYAAYIGFLIILAFCSGVIFAGYFAWETLEFLEDTGLLSNGTNSSNAGKRTEKALTFRHLPAVFFVAFLVVGSAYYLTNVASPFSDPFSCRVTGLVETPFTFNLDDFSDQMVTIEAELVGSTTHLDPANYTGPLVSTILNHAVLLPSAVGLRVIARDGYTVEFDDLSAVIADSRMLITNASDGLWLIAGDYDGSLWVRQISILEVY